MNAIVAIFAALAVVTCVGVIIVACVMVGIVNQVEQLQKDLNLEKLFRLLKELNS